MCIRDRTKTEHARVEASVGHDRLANSKTIRRQQKRLGNGSCMGAAKRKPPS